MVINITFLINNRKGLFMEKNGNDFIRKYEEFVNNNWKLPESDPMDKRMLYLGVAINEEAGEVAGEIKKAVRDDGGNFTSDRIKSIIKEMGDLTYYLFRMCIELDITIEDVIQFNVDKLEMRIKMLKKLVG